MDCANKYEVKIQKILENFLDPKYKIKNDVYLNTLFVNIVKNADGVPKEAINIDVYTNWLENLLTVWKSSKSPQGIVIFALNVISFLAAKEQTFAQFQKFLCIERFVQTFELTRMEISQSYKHAFIKICNACLEHQTGVQWLISKTYWKHVLAFVLTNQTLYVTQQGYKFVAGLLKKSYEVDAGFALKIVETIMFPLKEKLNVSINNPDNFLEINDEVLYGKLQPTLELIYGIFEVYMSEISVNYDFKVVNVFIQKYKIEDVLFEYMTISQSKEFTLALSKIALPAMFFTFAQEVITSKSMTADLGYKNLNCVFRVITINVNKSYYENVLQLTHWVNKYRFQVEPILGTYSQKRCGDVSQHQMLTLQMFPVACVGYKIRGIGHHELAKTDEIRGIFLSKLLSMLNTAVKPTVMKWRELIYTDPFIYPKTTLSLNYLIKYKQYFPRSAAITAFQTMIYCLNDIIFMLKETPQIITALLEQVNFFCLLLECIATFVKEFSITWTDSMETICVMSLAFDFISHPAWPPNAVVKALKLVEISISKYMAPNMVLLIDNTNGSTLELMPPLLYTKLHDPSWEVRDSTLEVLCSIAENAIQRFPSYQKIILESELSTLVVQMALNDGESFVRMSAVKCLQQMIVVNELWNDVDQVQNLHLSVLKSILEETEGIVRKELVNLVTKIYENQLFPGSIIDRVYDTMCQAAIYDLHWEVKVNALSFWDKVINLHLQNQGMIDGIFPTQTFSRENRKIVTLTDLEIQKRLIRCLNQLNSAGCLTVLMSSIIDDCDLEVSKCAIRITQPFLELLKQYDVNTLNVTLNTPPSPLRINSSSSPISSYSDYEIPMTGVSSVDSGVDFSPMPDFSEKIVDEILDTKDLNLLQSVFNSDGSNANATLPLKRRKSSSPKEFIEFVNQDLKMLLGDRQKWLESIDDFDSLLNDILKEYHEDEVNSMDCY
ncbi:unnamed protein product [Brassicogethes aeneus]|uniref:Uncharacterized protein n=1 Tax=Brassicogethes aeneus TaxID=1431903 RepID=A0A9P0FQP5_BRAAE|nr:unnamed protein product [Brassicogethes aeneus]